MECDFVIWIGITEGMRRAMKACFLILFLSNGKGSNHRDNGLLLNSAVSHQFEFSTLRSLPVKCEKAAELFFCLLFYSLWLFLLFFSAVEEKQWGTAVGSILCWAPGDRLEPGMTQ